MICTPEDSLNFRNDQEIKAILAHEDLYYSGKIIKIRQGVFSSNQERIILITDRAVYNLKIKETKRRIEIQDIAGITISKTSEQFVIHCKNDEYDYLYVSPNRLKIIEILETVYEAMTQNELLFYISSDKDLTKYVVSKSDRKKIKECMNKIEPKQLMSIREFIESGGNMNLNTHANSQLLEAEFQKGCEGKHKNENLNNFDIKCIIGKGKFSTVYLAQYEGEHVALKIFDKLILYKNNLVERVELEKNILCSFNDNKFLCHMKFYFTTKTKIVFVLPFYRGGDLFSLILKQNKLYETGAAFYAVQIAYMIGFLHSKNILYRDIKLENIMFNENGYLTLIDFGSCKIIENSQELESSFVGTPEYISPEVINGEGHNKMTDWWGFGVLLYELLHGVCPFHDEKIERIFDLINFSKLRFNSKVILNNDTKDFIRRLLAKNPNERIGKGEFQEIIKHPFFVSVNPNNIIIQKTSPPLKPEIDENNPASNFEDKYTGMAFENFEEAADISLLNKISYLFEPFEK